jgi:high-affinity nickel-transport protein
MKRGADAGEAGARGPLSRLLGAQIRARLSSPWQMVPVGVVFGLGLGTASEVALLGITSTAAGSASVVAALVLPLLFAGGMALADTANSMVTVHMYSTATDPSRGLPRFNRLMTGITATVALGVGSVYLAQVLVAELDWGFLAAMAGVGDHFEAVGYAIVGCYLAAWVFVVASTFRTRGRTLGHNPA